MGKKLVLDHEHIVRQVAEQTKIPIKTASAVMDKLLEVIAENLQAGHTIHLSNFGTFSIPLTEKKSQ